MSMIDRYRRRGGFLQLLNTIETSNKEKQEKFMGLIAEENPRWAQALSEKILTLDKVFSWRPELLCEIFPRIPVLQLGALLSHLPEPWRATCLITLAPKERRQIEEQLTLKKATPGEFHSSMMKLFNEIRRFESEGIFKFERVLPEMAIPENIEEQLNTQNPPPSRSAEIFFSEDTQLDYRPVQTGEFSLASTEETKTSIPANQPVTSPPLAQPIFHIAGAPEASGPRANPQSENQQPKNGPPSNIGEELAMLRKKLVQLSQENNRLQQENLLLRQKLESIKKIA